MAPKPSPRDITTDYPNILNNDLSAVVSCAYSIHKKAATQAFTRYCPSQFIIDEVRPEQSDTQPCQWQVDYHLNNNVRFPGGGTGSIALFKTLTSLRPPQTKIKYIFMPNPWTITIIYSVFTCPCNSNTFDFATARSCEMWEGRGRDPSELLNAINTN